MRGLVHFVVAWCAGIVMVFAGGGLTFGLREGLRSVGASLAYSLVGFALITVVLYLPFLYLLKNVRGKSEPLLAATGCLILSVVPIAAINVMYHSTRVVSYENAFLFLLLGVPGAVFGWLWAAESGRQRHVN